LYVFVLGENDVGPYVCQVLGQNYSVDISSEPTERFIVADDISIAVVRMSVPDWQ